MTPSLPPASQQEQSSTTYLWAFDNNKLPLEIKSSCRRGGTCDTVEGEAPVFENSGESRKYSIAAAHHQLSGGIVASSILPMANIFGMKGCIRCHRSEEQGVGASGRYEQALVRLSSTTAAGDSEEYRPSPLDER